MFKKVLQKFGEVYFNLSCSSFLQQPPQQRSKAPIPRAANKKQAMREFTTWHQASTLSSPHLSNSTQFTYNSPRFPHPTTSNSIMLPADDSPAPAAASFPPPSQPPPQSCFSKLNDFLHRDYVTDVAFYGFWLGFWLLMPTTIFLGTLALAAYDLVTMKGYRQPCGPVLITGCDMGFGKDLALALAAKGWTVRMPGVVGQGGAG